MEISTLTVSMLRDKILSTKNEIYFDKDIKGFMLEYRGAQRGTFYFRYRDPNKKIRLCKIGRLDEITAEKARIKAFEISIMVKSGADPKDHEQYLDKKKMTMNEIIREKFYIYCNIHEKEKSAKKSLIENNIIPYFGNKYINSIRPSDIINFEKYLYKKYSPGTVRQCLIHLKHIFNFVKNSRLQIININPFDEISIGGAKQFKERYLSNAELERLLVCLETYEDVAKSNIIKLLLMTGARKREIIELHWNEIDWQRKVLVLSEKRTKSRRKREIYLSNKSIEILQSIKQFSDIPFVFFNKKTRKPFVSIFTAWSTIRKRAKVENLRLHDLRHSFASFLINEGHTLYEVQKLLGHADPKTTMRYAHLSDRSLSEAVNNLSNKL